MSVNKLKKLQLIKNQLKKSFCHYNGFMSIEIDQETKIATVTFNKKSCNLNQIYELTEVKIDNQLIPVKFNNEDEIKVEENKSDDAEGLKSFANAEDEHIDEKNCEYSIASAESQTFNNQQYLCQTECNQNESETQNDENFENSLITSQIFYDNQLPFQDEYNHNAINDELSNHWLNDDHFQNNSLMPSFCYQGNHLINIAEWHQQFEYNNYIQDTRYSYQNFYHNQFDLEFEPVTCYINNQPIQILNYSNIHQLLNSQVFVYS